METLVRRKIMSNKVFKREPEPINDVEEILDDPVIEKQTFGTVSNCEKLNMRKEPVANIENIIRTIDAGTQVVIDLDCSTEDFYKVCCADGAEGYCMKEYITIEE